MPWATVFDNVFLPSRLAGHDWTTAAARVIEVLSRLVSDRGAPGVSTGRGISSLLGA